MEQKITLKVAGKEYPLKVTSPQQEQLMRMAAAEVNKLLESYDSRYFQSSLEDKLTFAAISQTMSKLYAQKKLSIAEEEAKALGDDLSAYLERTGQQ